MPDFSFRLPAIEELTIPQKIALEESRSLLVTGRPGSGKTVVSVFRFLKQVGQGQNAIFFTFNRTLMSAIRGTLRQKSGILLPDLNEEEVEAIVRSQIGSIHEWYGENFHAAMTKHEESDIGQNFTQFIRMRGNKKYDELFIDEAQDLRPIVIAKTNILSKTVSCGADRSQDLHGHYVDPADDTIFEILNGHQETIRQELTQNFRNTREIFDFARGFVPEDENVQEMDINELAEGERPDLRKLNDAEQLGLIATIVQQNPNSNIGIITHFKRQIDTIRDYLIANGYSCSADAAEAKSFSYYYSGMNRIHKTVMETHLRTPFVLSYESCKGLEFDIVIKPFFESADWALTHLKKDENGNQELDARGLPKYWTTPNHYYVASTRARRQLFLMYTYKPRILKFYTEDNRTNLFQVDDLPF